MFYHTFILIFKNYRRTFFFYKRSDTTLFFEVYYFLKRNGTRLQANSIMHVKLYSL